MHKMNSNRRKVLLDWWMGGGFSPLSLPNLEWYIDANDGVTVLDGGASVDSWHDLSSNYLNGISLTNASQLRATYLPTGLNSKPAIDFATSDFGFTSTWGSLFSKVGPITVFGKLRFDSTASATQGTLTSSPATDDRFQISTTANTQLNFAYWDGVAWAGLRHTVAASTDCWFVFQQHPGIITPRLWVNGVEILTTTTTNAGVAANAIYVLGSVRDTSTVSQFDGKISRFGVTSAIESVSTVAQINSYLATA